MNSVTIKQGGCEYYGSNDATLKESAINVSRKLRELILNKNGIFLNSFTGIVN